MNYKTIRKKIVFLITMIFMISCVSGCNNITSESGENLSEDEQLHYCLKDGTLEIRFAMSGEKLNISPNNKCLQVRIPKNIDLNIHSTSADVIAEKLEHDNILIATMSGNVEITEIVSNNADFSSNSGDISFGNIIDSNVVVKNISLEKDVLT